MAISGERIVSTLREDGAVVVALQSFELPEPNDTQVVVRMEAAPINPSDLRLLFGAGDVSRADRVADTLVVPPASPELGSLAGRIGQALPVGNEGAGTVIAAGGDPTAQALLGKVVACLPGGAFGTHVLVDARACLPLADGQSADQGASAFVNPLTALAFVETMRSDGFSAIIHTAAASNLGQMLVKLCAEDGIPLVNVVRKPEQASLLESIGAEHVVDTSKPDFEDMLEAAIEKTGAMLGFDAIGGGTTVNRLLTAMERVAAKGMAYSRYGSDTLKRVYIYGALDPSPTVIDRGFGFRWDVAGWLLTPHLAKMGPERAAALRQRVANGLTTTFASSYGQRIGLRDILDPEIARGFFAKATGEKFLVEPAR